MRGLEVALWAEPLVATHLVPSEFALLVLLVGALGTLPLGWLPFYSGPDPELAEHVFGHLLGRVVLIFAGTVPPVTVSVDTKHMYSTTIIIGDS